MYKCGVIKCDKGNIFIFSDNPDNVTACVKYNVLNIEMGLYYKESIPVSDLEIGKVYSNEHFKICLTGEYDYIMQLDGCRFWGVYYSLDLSKMNIPELESYSLRNKFDKGGVSGIHIRNYTSSIIGVMETLLELKEIINKDTFMCIQLELNGHNIHIYDNIPKEHIIFNFNEYITHGGKFIISKTIKHFEYDNLIKTLRMFATKLTHAEMNVSLQIDNLTLKGESGYKMLEDFICHSSMVRLHK